MKIEDHIKSFIIVPASKKAPSGEVLLSFTGKGWTILSQGASLSTELEFEYQPSPSNRDDNFYKRCRFQTLIEAILTFESYLGKSNDQLIKFYQENYNKQLIYFIKKLTLIETNDKLPE